MFPRAALLHGSDALLNRERTSEHMRRVLDLATSGAGEVATQQRLQHEYERIAIPSSHTLPYHMERYRKRLRNWNSHDAVPSL